MFNDNKNIGKKPNPHIIIENGPHFRYVADIWELDKKSIRPNKYEIYSWNNWSFFKMNIVLSFRKQEAGNILKKYKKLRY